MKLKYPAGFQYSIFGADFRGYASLEKGVQGVSQSTYYFSGQQNQVCFRSPSYTSTSVHNPQRRPFRYVLPYTQAYANIFQTTIPTKFTGPTEGNYLKHDEVEAGSTVWSPCGEQGMLNIKSEVRIIPMAATGLNLLTVDTVDAKFTQKYFVQWQKCDGSGNGRGSTQPLNPGQQIGGRPIGGRGVEDVE